MEEALHTFLPTNTSDNFSFWGSLIVVLLSGVALYFLFKRKSTGDAYRRQMMVAMLVFFALIIAATTAFFSFWSIKKISPVTLYEDRIETSYGAAQYDEILRAYIEMNGKRSLVSPGTTINNVRMLFIEETDGRMHVLSEENYDIDQILNKMRSLATGEAENE
ncbi:MAG: hypothetical protein DWQ02_12325 [Bacteroidetes bacterium]|nr:MAG: hypothetical protein DWQ02_12325 [Bacteroidota bacterium]